MDEETLSSICMGLRIAKEYGLEIEVIASALAAMKGDNTLSIKEAFRLGFDEWVK